MKNSFKFFSIVLMLLLASSIVLTGCMHDIAPENSDPTVNNTSSPISTDSSVIVDDTPTEQTELQKKFGAMYDISEDGKAITVIAQDDLWWYWHINYEKEDIHALSTEEVYFIIQDSIRIYMEYDRVILEGFVSVSSNKQEAERFPYLKEREICRPVTSNLDRDQAAADIHTIIMYRLEALSSPKAFFTGADAIRFVGGDPATYDGMYPETVFYIPGYSADTDRDSILSHMGSDPAGRTTDLFLVSVAGEAIMEFYPSASDSTTKVFPTEDLLYKKVEQ